MKSINSFVPNLQTIILVLIIVTGGCKKKDTIVFSMQELQAFTTLKVNLERRIADLEMTANKVARFFLPPGISEEKKRSFLAAGVEARDYIVACGFISPEGIMLYAEPEFYKQPEGLNLSKSEKFLYVLNEKKAYMSPIMITPTAVRLQEYLVPVYNAGNEFIGILTILVDTVKLLDFTALLPDLKTVNLLVFETDGELVFNNRTQRLGGGNLNALKGEGADELVDTVIRACKESVGAAYYNIFDEIYDMDFRYYAKWITVPLPGRDWRIFMNTEYEIEE
jgi:hypothetical protein